MVKGTAFQLLSNDRVLSFVQGTPSPNLPILVVHPNRPAFLLAVQGCAQETALVCVGTPFNYWVALPGPSALRRCNHHQQGDLLHLHSSPDLTRGRVFA